jgi:hypothetical protein
MAVTLSRNLKLRIDSNLTANAKYNLSVLDLLGSIYQTDSSNGVNLRSQTDVAIEPQSPEVGGSGIGGTVSIGNASHTLEAIGLWAESVTVPVSIGLKDQATSGTKYLRMKYKTDLNGSLDTSADRILSVDMEGADRSLVLGGSLGVLGGDLTLNLTGLTSITLPQTGTLSTLSGLETFTNKTISGALNTLSNIPYSSLLLTGSIDSADLVPSILADLLPEQSGNTGKFLRTNGSDVSWEVPAGGGGGSVDTYTENWTSGTSAVITHGLSTSDVVVSIIDDSENVVYADVSVTDADSITITSSEAPTGTWRVVVHG